MTTCSERQQVTTQHSNRLKQLWLGKRS